ENFERLLLVRARILFDLLWRKLLARLVDVRRVADQAGERADQERDLVPEILELAQLAHGDGVPQVQVRTARVVAAIDAQRSPFALRFDQPRAQLLRHVGFRLWVPI